MSERIDISRLERVANVLDRHGVEYIVIGGQAEWIMGGDRATFDVDVCYRRSSDNHRRLALALLDLEARLRGAPHDLPFRIDERTFALTSNLTLDTVAGDFDLLGHVEPIGDFEALAARARNYDMGGRVFRVIDLDDLIRVKRHINRVKDQQSLLQLLAIKRIRDESGGDDPRRLDS